MISFGFVCMLLFPLAWTICNGPKVAFVQLAGGLVALSWLAFRRQVLVMLRLSPFIFAGLVYAFAAYVSAERRDSYPYQAALVLLFFGIPTGVCLRRLSQQGRDRAVAWAMVAFAAGMSVVGIIILKNPEVQRITAESAGAFQRTNGSDDEAITYLRAFSISNIIIGIVPFTLFALASFPAVLTARNLALRLFVCAAAILAGYVNVELATRTTLVAAALSTSSLMLLAFRSMSWRRLLGFGVGFMGLMISGVWYIGRKSDRFYYLMDRFAAMGSDSRLGIWTEAIRIIERAPEGHGIRQLQSHEWAHNLFLDVGLTDGWIAIAAIVVMYCGVFYYAWRTARVSGFFDSDANVIMLAWLLSTFAASMICPPQGAFLAILHIALGYFAPSRAPAYSRDRDWTRSEQERQLVY